MTPLETAKQKKKHCNDTTVIDVDDYDMEESEWRELYDFECVTAWQPLPQPYKENENGN